jgi:ubiquitin-protein ligase
MPSLPRPLLVDRLKNEIEKARTKTRHVVLVEDPTLEKFPVTLSVTLRNAPGPVRKDGKVGQADTHRLKLQITTDYPYQKPIVQWMSEIFHPNIMGYSEGGFVCTRFLDNWTWESTIADFLKGLEALLQKPNPHNPYATCICREAADYFLKLEPGRK